jgi:CheY-like chemotaxis protein/two-component sensor histidine kinase
MAGQGDFADEDLRDVHAMMERQLAHMVRLIDDLLDFSRISRGTIKLQKEPIALQAVIRQALETSKPLIEAGRHALDVHLPDDPVMLDADLVRLSQVFANLLNNAAKYTEPGGRISIRARCEGADAIVSVRDTGIGIPQEMLGGVFELFAQVENPLRRSQDGLGIGLSLVKSLVQLHGGSVVAHSAGLGQGSEFVVRMPLAQGDLDGSREISSATHADPALRPTTRILAVDDNKDSADSLARMLRMLGGDVQVVYDGPSALEALTICRPAIVFMDLGMPGMDGCEVARRIREAPENRNVLLVAMTGWGKEEDRSRSRAAGFGHHLVKPVDLGGLKTLLDECAAAHVADEPPDTQRPRS